MTESVATSAGTEAVAQESPVVSHVQGDLFCQQCGSNLMGQPVRRTAQNHLLVAACPACQAVNHAESATPYALLFRHRLATMGLAVWGAFVISCLLAAIVAQVVGQVYAFEWSTDRGATSELRTIAISLIAVSLAISSGLGGLAACALYHWRTRGHLLMVILCPTISMLLVCSAYVVDSHRILETIGIPYISMTAGMQALAGILGVILGRPIGRLAVRLSLPNRSQQCFAFLWRRDGMQGPTVPIANRQSQIENPVTPP